MREQRRPAEPSGQRRRFRDRPLKQKVVIIVVVPLGLAILAVGLSFMFDSAQCAGVRMGETQVCEQIGLVGERLVNPTDPTTANPVHTLDEQVAHKRRQGALAFAVGLAVLGGVWWWLSRQVATPPPTA